MSENAYALDVEHGGESRTGIMKVAQGPAGGGGAGGGVRAIPLGEVDAEYFESFDAERARVLRQRISWYCIVALCILAFSLVGAVFEMLDHCSTWAYSMLYDGLLTLPFVCTLVYVKGNRPARAELVRLVTVLTIVVSLIAMFFELSDNANNAPPTDPQEMKGAAITTALTFPVFLTLVCVLIPMTTRELTRIVVPCMVFLPVVLFLKLEAPARLVGLASSIQAAACVPGIAWARWRYSEFDAKFQASRLKERYQDLSSEAREISAELTQARRLHEALFPTPIMHGPVSVSYRYEPMREIGGDFLFFHTHTADGKTSTLVVVIDVSGHGIPAALAVNRLHGELQRACAMRPEITPGELIRDLNAYAMVALAPQGVFATAIAVRVEPGNAKVRWANAGHPPGLLRGQLRETTPLAGTTTMLGVIEPAAYDANEQECVLMPGDVVIAYTDGANETRDAAGREFGTAGINAFVDEFKDPAPANGRSVKAGSLAQALFEAVRGHREGRPLDDTLVVEVRVGRFVQSGETPSSVMTASESKDEMLRSWRRNVGLRPTRE